MLCVIRHVLTRQPNVREFSANAYTAQTNLTRVKIRCAKIWFSARFTKRIKNAVPRIQTVENSRNFERKAGNFCTRIRARLTISYYNLYGIYSRRETRWHRSFNFFILARFSRLLENRFHIDHVYMRVSKRRRDVNWERSA